MGRMLLYDSEGDRIKIRILKTSQEKPNTRIVFPYFVPKTSLWNWFICFSLSETHNIKHDSLYIQCSSCIFTPCNITEENEEDKKKNTLSKIKKIFYEKCFAFIWIWYIADRQNFTNGQNYMNPSEYVIIDWNCSIFYYGRGGADVFSTNIGDINATGEWQ